MHSLVRYMNQVREEEGRPLHWGRVQNGTDPYPFLGQPPVMTDEEYESRAGVARYFHWKFFDTRNEEQMKEYQAVMDLCLSGMATQHHLQRFVDRGDGQGKVFHYVEWIRHFMQVPPEGN